MTVVIQADRLEALVGEIFAAAGCSEVECGRIARRLVAANLTGHDSHGVVRTHLYVQSLAHGAQFADVTVEVLVDADAFALIDGHYGMGQTVGEQAVQLGIDKARASGVSVIGLRHAGHLGRIGDWAEMAADAGLVSLHLVNVAGSQLVAPFGAVDRRMGTNPVAIGVPRPDGPPLLLDFATSVVAEGKVQVALRGGPPVPMGALVSPEGDLTDDPVVLYGEVPPGSVPNPMRGAGALRAMGEHKGSGLSMMCEILAGVLTGSGTAAERPFCNGMLSIYLTPSAFGAADDFAAGVREYVEWFTSARPVGEGLVFTPGEPERLRREERLRDGVPLTEGVWESIRTAAGEVGIDTDRLEKLAAPA